MALLHPKSAPLPREDERPDEELVQCILAGERMLYAVILRRHNQRLFRIVRAVVRQDDEAEDIVQHAYVTAYHKLSQFRGEASFSTWISRIAINEALGRARASQRRDHIALVAQDSEDPPSGPEASPEDAAHRREMGRLLERHIDELPESLRVVFVLRDVQELDTRAAAAMLDISEEAVRVRLHRARHLLQEKLSRLMEAAPEAFRFAGERCDRIVDGVMAKLGIIG